MEAPAHRAIAIVGLGAVLPDAPDVPAFWENLKAGRYSISETPPERWDPARYYDADPAAPDKTYSKIGGWIRDYDWDPLGWRLPIPPKVGDQMDRAQRWAIMAARQALLDYGWPERPLDGDRTAVIVGNAMAGDKHYQTALRIHFPEFAAELERAEHFRPLPADVRREILAEVRRGVGAKFPEITEDTMPGELANIIAGRLANLFNFHGPNYVVDAACASAMAAINAAVEGLEEGDYDAVLTGGVDANMSASTFVKFCKIGALSATGTRPYAEGADGFVMGEGAALFLLKRLADAERDGDRIYAVLRGLGGSSDGKGKGITAPNPIGQVLAVERAWANAGLDPASATYVEGHGTSTKVGDVIEVESLVKAFGAAGAPAGTVALGSVKSNIGHLKGAAGAAGILKTALALYHKALPPSLHFERPNPNIDFARAPFFVNTEHRPWDATGPEDVRRAGVSAFGFGGTNFHAVLEEYVPGRLRNEVRTMVGYTSAAPSQSAPPPAAPSLPAPGDGGPASSLKAPLRGALVIGGRDEAEIAGRLAAVQREAEAGRAPAPAPPREADLHAPVRLALDYADAADLTRKAGQALKALELKHAGMWKALRAQGVFLGRGPAPKVAFLYTGQGSQYVNMLKPLREAEPLVAEAFAEADRVMAPILGRPLSAYIFVDGDDPAAVARLEEDLRQTEITQPAVLATDLALSRLFAAYGIEPDMVMGHSLGEYGALVAAGSLSFADALKAVSARGHAMKEVSVEDNGLMAAALAPLAEVERILQTIDDYVVIANINSTGQAVLGGSTSGVRKAMEAVEAAGYKVIPLNVSHAFHTRIVAPATEPLLAYLRRLDLRLPTKPIVANVTGEFYPMGPGTEEAVMDLLGRQIASPVQFVRGLRTLYDAGARVFVEVGPKKALHGFVEDVLGERDDVLALFSNHPKVGDAASVNQALCGLYASGLGVGVSATTDVGAQHAAPLPPPSPTAPPPHPHTPAPPHTPPPTMASDDTYRELGRLFADFLDRGRQIYEGQAVGRPAPAKDEPVVITGAALGLPGTERVFDDANVGRLLRGEQLIDVIPTRVRQAMVDKHVTRLVKSAQGEPRFEVIEGPAEAIKLAGRAGRFDLAEEFGYPADRLDALDATTKLAIAAGLDALRDAGLPLAMRYKTTTTGTRLPERWMLPETLRDETGVIFASAFPGLDNFAAEAAGYWQDRALRQRLDDLRGLRARFTGGDGDDTLARELDRRVRELEAELAAKGYTLDRKFLFRVLPMGHSQFAEYVGARGPNTQINAACASTTQAVGLAEDWIRQGRCRRVLVVAADDVTSDHLLEWIGAGFLASGAAATDETVEEAALPFDRRRHGMIIGMGAAALVVEAAGAARERGVRPIAEVLATATANSAFHGTRLDVDHIRHVMEGLVAEAERAWGVDRRAMAPQTVFVSHETYTPARGGSAQAEIDALRHVFGPAADEVVIANTKGFTGHAMAAGLEDVLAVKALETGLVPPVANFKEVDPDLGRLNLSQGGAYPVRYALRLGAGFGSQISLSLVRWVPPPDGARTPPDRLGFAGRIADAATWEAWLRRMSGHDAPALEVVQRTLRLKDQGAPAVKGTPRTEPEVAPAPALAPAPAPTPAPTPAQAPVPEVAVIAGDGAAPAAGDAVQEKVLALVAEQTGYPPEMLDLDLDLEADLGIDTVKQAEMFAAVRGAWRIERDENLKLRDFPTLRHVVGFVYAKRPDLAQAAPEAPAPAPVEAPPPAEAPVLADDPVRAVVLRLVAEQTGYPIEMLDLDLDLEADLGIDTVKQAELFAAVRGQYGIERDENLQLRNFPTLAHTIEFVYGKRPDLRPDLRPGQPAPAPAPAPAETPAPAAPPAPLGEDPIQRRVLELVAEQTGYPVEMLDLDLDLEADLGVDTVKQAEMFARVRGEYGIPRDEHLQLRDFPTLGHVIGFVYDRAPGLAPSGDGAAAPSPAPPAPASAEAPVFAASLEAAAAIPRRVPVPVLRPPLDVCKTTGVTLGEGSRVVVMTDAGGVGEKLAERLEKRGVGVLVIDDAPAAEDLTQRLLEWRGGGPVTGLYWLPALDEAGDPWALAPEAWREALRVRVKLLYAAARALYDDLAAPGAFLVAATRLGGCHGYDAAGAVDPLGGAITGFAKTLRRERPDALVKAVDFAPSRKTAALADRLIEETLRDPGAVEIGYRDGERVAVGLEVQPLPEDGAGMVLGKDTVFVVTGAAGSIVSAITADLAAASGGTFHLLDLVPEPDRDDPDLARFTADREGLKRDLFERIKARGERATPALVEKELARLERAHAALAAIRAVEAAGGTAHYHRADLRDAEAVRRAIDAVREENGRIDVLLHAGGLEISRFLPDKAPDEFDLVFDVKADGWYNLLHAIGAMPLGAAVVFSSVAARFGNAGQADYAAANDLLCKAVSGFRTARPATRGIAIDWTAWGGIGMATRGSIPKMMELAGIEMLPPEAGIPLVRRELTASGWAGELVAGKALGVLLDELDEAGGLDLAALAGEPGPMALTVRGFFLHGGLTVEATLDPREQPFLDDHRINGTPVLPGVMGIEGFAEAARRVFPDLHVAAVEDVRFLAPFKFYRDEPRTVTIRATFRRAGEAVLAACRLVGTRDLPAGPETTTHFTATVRLTAVPPEAPTATPPAAPEGDAVAREAIYRLYFHGPAYQVLERAWPEGERVVGRMASDLPANHAPEAAPLEMAPRLIELCFQTAGLAEIGASGTMGLPAEVGRVTAYRAPEPTGRLFALVTPRDGRFDAVVVDEAGAVYLALEGYRTVALPGTFEAAVREPLRAVLH